MVNTSPLKGTHQSNSLFDIVLEISCWVFDGFTYIGTGGKMDAGVDFVLTRYTFKQKAISHATLIEWHARLHSSEMTAGQIIHNDDLFTAFFQTRHGNTSDIACTPRHKNCHIIPFYLSGFRVSTRGLNSAQYDHVKQCGTVGRNEVRVRPITVSETFSRVETSQKIDAPRLSPVRPAESTSPWSAKENHTQFFDER